MAEAENVDDTTTSQLSGEVQNVLEEELQDLSSVVDKQNISPRDKKCLAGIVACVMADPEWKTLNPEFNDSWFKQFCTYLELPDAHYMGSAPLVHDKHDPSPFLTELDTEFAKVRICLCILHSELVDHGHYDARVREFIKEICKTLEVDWDRFLIREHAYCQAMFAILKAKEEDEEKKKKKSRWKYAKIAGVGLLAGGAIAITGGLAAPFVGAGLLATGITSTGVVATGLWLTTYTGALTFGALFGLGGAAYTGHKMSNRCKDISEFEFKRVATNPGLEVVLQIPGYLLSNENIESVCTQSELLFPYADNHVLQWQTNDLKVFGIAIENFVRDTLTQGAVSYGALEVMKTTVLATLIGALTIPAYILQGASMLDNPFSVIMNLSDQAGIALSEALIQGVHGSRPITLIGYSTGARVIMVCLEELFDAAQKAETLAEKERICGMVENVYLFGCPKAVHAACWNKARAVVAGRFVNGYCPTDWVLKLCYRASRAVSAVAGLQCLEFPGIEDFDCSEYVDSHSDYSKEMPYLLAHLKGTPLERPEESELEELGPPLPKKEDNEPEETSGNDEELIDLRQIPAEQVVEKKDIPEEPPQPARETPPEIWNPVDAYTPPAQQ